MIIDLPKLVCLHSPKRNGSEVTEGNSPLREGPGHEGTVVGTLKDLLVAPYPDGRLVDLAEAESCSSLAYLAAGNEPCA